VFGRAARRGTATRIPSGALSLLAAVAILSGPALMLGLQCDDSQLPPSAAPTGASMAVHEAPAAALGGAVESAGQLAGIGSNHDDSEPCLSAQAATPITSAASTGTGVLHSRNLAGSARDAATDLPHATVIGGSLTRSCVLRT
jgi:hypothetical protein